MKVTIKSFDVNMEVKNKGIELLSTMLPERNT